MSICPSVNLSICQSVHPSICLSVHQFISLSVRCSVFCRAVLQHFNPQFSLYFCPSVRHSVISPSILQLSILQSCIMYFSPPICPSIRICNPFLNRSRVLGLLKNQRKKVLFLSGSGDPPSSCISTTKKSRFLCVSSQSLHLSPMMRVVIRERQGYTLYFIRECVKNLEKLFSGHVRKALTPPLLSHFSGKKLPFLNTCIKNMRYIHPLFLW